MTSRFKVVLGSQSGHCCFEATVIDTSEPVMLNGKHYNGQFKAVCECMNMASAGVIAEALNAAWEGAPTTNENGPG